MASSLQFANIAKRLKLDKSICTIPIIIYFFLAFNCCLHVIYLSQYSLFATINFIHTSYEHKFRVLNFVEIIYIIMQHNNHNLTNKYLKDLDY